MTVTVGMEVAVKLVGLMYVYPQDAIADEEARDLTQRLIRST